MLGGQVMISASNMIASLDGNLSVMVTNTLKPENSKDMRRGITAVRTLWL